MRPSNAELWDDFVGRVGPFQDLDHQQEDSDWTDMLKEVGFTSILDRSILMKQIRERVHR